jgi:hypothetical protein
LISVVTGILSELEYNNGEFPSDALKEVIAKRDEIIPELLEVLINTSDHTAELAEEDGYFAHIYAMYLLAQFRETRAYPLVYQLLMKPFEILDNLLGDVITDGLPGILASICGGDTGLIKRIIENSQLNEYIRSAALHALVILVAEGIKPREEIIDYFKGLFRGRLERCDSFVWNSLVSSSSRLDPKEVVDDIKRAYDDGLVDTFFISMEDIQEQLAKTSDTVLEELKSDSHYHLINDTIDELNYWACFHRENKETEDLRVMEDDYNEQETAHVGPKIGRNDPCPCGSGKKYKKCCGKC